MHGSAPTAAWSLRRPASTEGRYRLRIWDWERGEVVRTISADASLDGLRSQRFPYRDGRSGRTGGDLGRGERNALGGARRELRRRSTTSPSAPTDRASPPRASTARFGCSRRTPAHSSWFCEGIDAASRAWPSARTARSSPPRAACDGVRIWALDIDDLLEIARQQVQVTRSLTDEECRQYLHVDRCPQA